MLPVTVNFVRFQPFLLKRAMCGFYYLRTDSQPWTFDFGPGPAMLISNLLNLGIITLSLLRVLLSDQVVSVQGIWREAKKQIKNFGSSTRNIKFEGEKKEFTNYSLKYTRYPFYAGMSNYCGLAGSMLDVSFSYFFLTFCYNKWVGSPISHSAWHRDFQKLIAKLKQ